MSNTEIPRLHGRKLRRWAIRNKVPIRVAVSDFWPFLVPLRSGLLGSSLIPANTRVMSIDAEMIKPQAPLTRDCLLPDLPENEIGLEIRV